MHAPIRAIQFCAGAIAPAARPAVKTIALLPADDRPVNYEYPRCLGRAAGLDVHLPARELLGTPWRAGRISELAGWLRREAATADALVVSVDTLAYGGLVPSRISADSVELVLARLAILRELKSARPELPVFACSAILRVNRFNSAEEEKRYCGMFGSRLFRVSWLEHRAMLGEATAAEVAERDALRAQIPREYYEDYRRGRARNHAINRAMLDWASDGVFDYLLLAQDDGGEYGWNVAEARALQSSIRARGLGLRATTCPGADGASCLLLARYAGLLAGFAPRVWPRYSGVAGPVVVTAYEDRCVQELLKALLTPLNGFLADSRADSDLTVFINAPVRRQGQGESQWLLQEGVEKYRVLLPPELQPWLDHFVADEDFRATRREMESPQRNPEEFVRALVAELRAGRPVALADLAFAHAADLQLVSLLRQQPAAALLAGYGGWQTAATALGTALAEAVVRVTAYRDAAPREQLGAHLEFLFLRLVNGAIYHAGERMRCMLEDLPRRGLRPTMERLPEDQVPVIEARVQEQLSKAAATLREGFISSGLVQDVRMKNVHLPWGRLAEIGCDVQIELP